MLHGGSTPSVREAMQAEVSVSEKLPTKILFETSGLSIASLGCARGYAAVETSALIGGTLVGGRAAK